jgi:hypothetical protein
MQADRSLFPGGKSEIRRPPKGQGAGNDALAHSFVPQNRIALAQHPNFVLSGGNDPNILFPF